MSRSHRPLESFNEVAYRQAKPLKELEVSPQDVEELAAILVDGDAEDTPATTFENAMHISAADNKTSGYSSTKKRWNPKWLFRYPVLTLGILRLKAFTESVSQDRLLPSKIKNLTPKVFFLDAEICSDCIIYYFNCIELPSRQSVSFSPAYSTDCL